MTSTNPSETGSAATADTAATANGSFALPEMLDLTQATHLRDSMTRLSAESSILLDASSVERMSTPCVQILLVVGLAAQATGKSFKISNASEVFRTAIADLGLHPEFSNWMN